MNIEALRDAGLKVTDLLSEFTVQDVVAFLVTYYSHVCYVSGYSEEKTLAIITAGVTQFYKDMKAPTKNRLN